MRENWTLYTSNDERNPLDDDRLNYDVLNHTDLSRYGGLSGDINLETLRWGNYDLIVIDESHNFRNKPTDRTQHSRYERLMNDVIRAGVRTKVLMLSATPVNNRLLDLRNQIEIITEGDDAYLAETDNIGSITAVCRLAQQRFGEWSELPDEKRTTESFAAMVNADYFKLLDVFTIARSRKHIAKYYRDEAATFHTRLPPISLKPRLDTLGKLPSVGEMNDSIDILSGKQIIQCFSVKNVDLIESRPFAGDGFNTVDDHGLGIIKIICNHDFIAAVEKFHDGMRADKTGTASYQNFHDDMLFSLLFHCNTSIPLIITVSSKPRKFS